ncbi:hypothetical protein RRG08_059252 [Elysia crispata]|uniref:Uncharacterized protein n=1 Tax=Elysia crispata TaxID=231223 RepID=A0AAE0Y884_9GAST|nr:hypothetical protein RRG08_059252 [Elysia crispata]
MWVVGEVVGRVGWGEKDEEKTVPLMAPLERDWTPEVGKSTSRPQFAQNKINPWARLVYPDQQTVTIETNGAWSSVAYQNKSKMTCAFRSVCPGQLIACHGNTLTSDHNKLAQRQQIKISRKKLSEMKKKKPPLFFRVPLVHGKQGATSRYDWTR